MRIRAVFYLTPWDLIGAGMVIAVVLAICFWSQP
jgi:hypothetical protein